MIAKQTLDLYAEVTGSDVEAMDDEEISLALSTVRAVRSAKSEAESLSAVLWMGHGEGESLEIISKLRK
tara:strand:- start:4914 stop:5120 length:207 start_codon:yes stop_codon:yes gene_type:complete